MGLQKMKELRIGTQEGNLEAATIDNGLMWNTIWDSFDTNLEAATIDDGLT